MTGIVYFLKSGDSVKVGYTTDLDKRIRAITTGNPQNTEVLGCVPGSKHLERAIHAHVKHLRQRGEWFADCQELRGVLYALIELGPSSIGFVEPEPRETWPVKKQKPEPESFDIFASVRGAEWPKVFERMHGILAEVEVWGLRTMGAQKPHAQAIALLHRALDQLHDLGERAIKQDRHEDDGVMRVAHSIVDELHSEIVKIIRPGF